MLLLFFILEQVYSLNSALILKPMELVVSVGCPGENPRRWHVMFPPPLSEQGSQPAASSSIHCGAWQLWTQLHKFCFHLSILSPQSLVIQVLQSSSVLPINQNLLYKKMWHRKIMSDLEEIAVHTQVAKFLWQRGYRRRWYSPLQRRLEEGWRKISVVLSHQKEKSIGPNCAQVHYFL